MAQVKILLAEDDIQLGPILKAYLEQKGFSCSLAQNGVEAVEMFANGEFGICILDVMMPLKDGFLTAAEIKGINKNTPLIFLTAKTAEEDKLNGFTLGADDYITKPFSMDELMMRINAIMRRSMMHSDSDNIFKFSNFTFDYNRQILTYNEKETGVVENMKLTSKESELLRIFCLTPNEVVPRATILRHIWKNDTYFNARSMDVYVTKLRKYVRKDPNVDIVNQHGVGFKLVFPKQD